MRKIILQLAVSLDGFIEGPNGEFDWCFTDQDYGMNDFMKRIDTIFMGRKTYELSQRMGGSRMKNMKEYVFSNSLKEVESNTILVNGDLKTEVEKIKNQQGKDIWLFGGAELTKSLTNLNLVDEFHLVIHPILLGGGKPLFNNFNERVNLKMIEARSYSSGLVLLKYSSKLKK